MGSQRCTAYHICTSQISIIPSLSQFTFARQASSNFSSIPLRTTTSSSLHKAARLSSTTLWFKEVHKMCSSWCLYLLHFLLSNNVTNAAIVRDFPVPGGPWIKQSVDFSAKITAYNCTSLSWNFARNSSEDNSNAKDTLCKAAKANLSSVIISHSGLD